MGQSVAMVGNVADTQAASVRRRGDRTAAESVVPTSEAVSTAADYRLVIEPVTGGRYIYKTLDRRTGEVVQQLPREEVARMAEHGDYAAGDVFAGDA